MCVVLPMGSSSYEIVCGQARCVKVSFLSEGGTARVAEARARPRLLTARGAGHADTAQLTRR